MKIVSDMHFIRKYILKVLTYTDWARFRDMRPKSVDSNLYNYHLKQLVKDGFIEYDPIKGYRLSPTGMRFVDHISLESFEPRWQPKILTMLVVVDNGDICLWPKYKQPFISSWSLPSGKVHYENETVEAAALREASYLSNKPPKSIRHSGVVEFTAQINNEVVSHTISHIFIANIKHKDVTHPKVEWIPLEKLSSYVLSPGTKDIVELSQIKKDFFYKSLVIDWE